MGTLPSRLRGPRGQAGLGRGDAWRPLHALPSSGPLLVQDAGGSGPGAKHIKLGRRCFLTGLPNESTATVVEGGRRASSPSPASQRPRGSAASLAAASE